VNARQLQLALLAGGLIGCAWLIPGSIACAALGWLGSFALVAALRLGGRVYWASYISGILINILGFYWLLNTIEIFGGFPTFAAIGVFSFFVLISALQFPLATLFIRNAPSFLERGGLHVASGWVLGELVSVRIFPWYIGHTQLGFLPFAQVADLGGCLLISFLMIWISDALVASAFFRVATKRLLAPLTVFAIVLFYGETRLLEYSEMRLPARQVVVVQPAFSLEEKMDSRNFIRHEQTLLAMSQTAVGDDDLVIWPETALMRWLPAAGGDMVTQRAYPRLAGGQPLFMGALTSDAAGRHFNSAVFIPKDGKVPAAYHKRILMPFGEYMPFESWFPSLRQLNPLVGDFIAGDTAQIFNLDAQQESAALILSPLICYEDIVPRLAREAVLKGADVLVNLTNDSWFGDTAAPFQHHTIAAFRSIETRRYLIRSTNSGVSAIVDPLGQSGAALPVYQPGNLVGSVSPINEITVYTLIGDLPYWLLLGVTVAVILFRRVGPA